MGKKGVKTQEPQSALYNMHEEEGRQQSLLYINIAYICHEEVVLFSFLHLIKITAKLSDPF